MILRFLKKILPLSIKRRVLIHLRQVLYPSISASVTGKSSSADFWWPELENMANKSIFPKSSNVARQACAEIREAYYPLLERYNVNPTDFFLGSIKNEEAEALYQLVLERKPKIAYQIGTFVGYSALVIAHALRANGRGILIAVDPEIPHRTFINPVNVARKAAKMQGLEQYIQFERGWHSGPSGDYIGLKLKRSIPVVGLAVLNNLRDQGIDFAFIDGDHSSACTLADFLLLKEYLNIHGVAVFHDVFTWPTVAQAISLLWNDIHYFVKGTSAYFALDVRHGHDGLAILERIADEHFPTLCLKLENEEGQPISDAKVKLPSIEQLAVSDIDGTIYILIEIPLHTTVNVSHPNYEVYNGELSVETNGDFAEETITLHLNSPY